MLGKFCIIKRNFPKSKKKQQQNKTKKNTFNPNNNPFFISENLTRMNEPLVYQGRKLKCNNLVNTCYAREGIVTIKINERSKAMKSHHMNDLLELFPNFDFEGEAFHDASPDILGQSMNQLDLVPLQFVFDI